MSKDGVAAVLLANVNGVNDAAMAGAVGAAGVGLYRTEYLFLTHPSVPDEEEQFQTYCSVIESAPNRTVTIRTIDLGADKSVPYFGREGEANPFMGFRSIRLSYAYPEFFRTQLRAILRAGVRGKVELLFPMVSNLEEVRDIRRMVDETRAELRQSGVPFAEDVPLGVMIEVPAAALCIEEIVREVDFVSIGSNDLIQYLMAADRDNPKVAHLCEPFSPALLAAAEPRYPRLQRTGQAGDALRRDGRPGAVRPAVVRDGTEAVQHESGVLAVDPRVGAPHHAGGGSGGCAGRAAHGDRRRGAVLSDHEGARNLAGNGAAGRARVNSE